MFIIFIEKQKKISHTVYLPSLNFPQMLSIWSESPPQQQFLPFLCWSGPQESQTFSHSLLCDLSFLSATVSLLSTLRGNISFWRENVALLHLQSIPTTFGLEWKHSLGLLQQQLYAPFCSMYEAGHGGSHFQPQHSGARQIFQFQIRLVYIVSWFQAKQGYTGQTKAIPEWVSRPPQYFA